MASPIAPVPTPLSKPYWEGCAQGELRLQRCKPCDAPFFPPRIRCPRCLSADLEWVPVSGQATLYSYMIHHRAAPGFEDRVPYCVALVDLAEGPRMMTNVVGVPSTPEELVLDMDLKVRFEARGDMFIPVFGPVSAQS